MRTGTVEAWAMAAAVEPIMKPLIPVRACVVAATRATVWSAILAAVRWSWSTFMAPARGAA